MGAVETALANPDVQQALAVSSPMMYGSQGIDVPVFEITLGSHVIDVGASCGIGTTSCTEIPAGVQALVDELKAVDQDMVATPACETLPASLAEGSCTTGRTLTTVCTACGPAGGCPSMNTECAKVCSANGDCAGDSIGQFCSAQLVCEQGGCI